jgi:hypothetical protein
MKANNTQPVFSKPIFFLLSILILCTPFWQGCRSKPVIEIKSNVIAMQAIALLDVNNGPLRNIHAAKITLIDSGKMILSSNGIAFETIVLNEGFMSVGLSPKAQFSVEKPYRFSIRVEAVGYMTTVRTIVIADSTPNYTPIYMVKLDSLPPGGLAASTGSITAISNGIITQTQVLSTIFNQGSGDTLLIKIPEGTQLLSGKKPIQTKGDLSYRILLGKPKDSVANLVFPGGFEVTDAINEDGKKLADAANPIFFTTAGWFSMEMNIGNTLVDGFSKPLDVEVPIVNSVINPITQRPLKAGDTIPTWSLNNQTGTWRREAIAEIISSNNGKLIARIKINHLSTVNFDFWTGGCMGEILVDFRPAEFSGSHLTDYVNTADDITVKTKLIDFSNITTPNTTANPLHVLRAPANKIGKLSVHESQDPTSQKLGESSPLSCTSTGTCNDVPPGNCLSLLGVASPATTLHFHSDQSTPPRNLCANSVWFSTGGAYNAFVGVLNSAGVVEVPQQPSGTGQKDIFLWYVKNPNTTPESVSLRIIVNFDIDDTNVKIYEGSNPTPIGTGSSIRILDGGGAVTDIDITIPNGIISRWCN